jgi:hypothetical protein
MHAYLQNMIIYVSQMENQNCDPTLEKNNHLPRSENVVEGSFFVVNEIPTVVYGAL